MRYIIRGHNQNRIKQRSKHCKYIYIFVDANIHLFNVVLKLINMGLDINSTN